jgi:hypothetical protein
MSAMTDGKKKAWNWRVVDCIAATFRQDWMVSFLHRLTGVIDVEAEAVLGFLMAREDNGMFSSSGNGYLQPLVQLEDFIFTSPLLLRMMPSMRNMLYALNKMDSGHFSRTVAHHLEVELLKELSELCDTIPSLLYKSNINWSLEGRDGEVDAILYDSENRFFLALQAKAAIPPEGARMTRNVEARTIEAIDQIASFEKLSRESQEKILTNAIGKVHKDFQVKHGILTRSGLGTNKAWEASKGISVMNIGLLRYALKGSDKTLGVFLKDPTSSLLNVIDDLVNQYFISWGKGIVPLLDRDLHIPLMELDLKGLQDLREHIADI